MRETDPPESDEPRLEARSDGLGFGLLLIATALLLLASNFIFFYYRDNFSTHYPVKVLSAQILRSGDLPLWNFHAGGGQPLAGNPNYLTFYPDTLLYLVLPPHIAFNFHFFLHLMLAFIACRALCREAGADSSSSSAAAVIYVFSGIAASACAFYNLVTALALVPLALLAVKRFLRDPGWKSALLMGASFGLIGLAGEPVIVAGVALSCGILAVGKLRTLRQAGLLGLALLLALAIVSPLLIAFSEIASEVERGVHRYSAETVLAASLRPARLLELFVGPFSGLTTDLGPGGAHALRGTGKWPPLFSSIFLGAILLPALFQKRTHVRLLAIFIAMTFLALGRHNPIVAFLVEQAESLRFFRYPEKLVLIALASAIPLIALWLTRALASRRACLGGAALIAIASALIITRLDSSPHQFRLLIGAAIAIATLTLFAILREGRPLRLAALIMTLVPLGYWFVRALPVDRFDLYRSPIASSGLAGSARELGRIFHVPDSTPLALPRPQARWQYRTLASMFPPLFGVSDRAAYALDRSPEGMYSYLSRVVSERASIAVSQIGYLERLGVRSVISRTAIEDPSLELIKETHVGANPLFLYRVGRPMPRVKPVTSVIAASTVAEMIEALESGTDETVAPRVSFEIPTGAARVVSVQQKSQTLRVVIEADAPATILVNESYFRGWRAGTGGTLLKTIPLNLDRLGVIVPAGTSEIQLLFGQRRLLIALAWGLSLVILVASLVVRPAVRVQ